MLKEPVELTLYDDNDEEIETYKLMTIRWGLLKRALSLSKFVKKADDVTEEEFDAIGQLVCDMYRNKFTLDDLDTKADKDQVMSAFQSIVRQSGKSFPNAEAGKE